MSLEQMLNEKTYYQKLIQDEINRHPVEVLGSLLAEEQKKEIPDSSYIRFSQGEVYYHNRDFEAAIYKWNNVHNELETWARKNCADAYFHLELYTTAEEIYQSIQTDSLLLKTEIMLQLFTLYRYQKQPQKAHQVIKEMVQLNPDYRNVSDMARRFYEETYDWESAIELVLNEGERTEQLNWFEHLKGYIHKGYTRKLAPSYFLNRLGAVYRLETSLFEQIILALWKSYREERYYLDWIKELNRFVNSNLSVDFHSNWHDLPFMYKEVYENLISGQYSMKLLTEMIPGLLEAWCRVADNERGMLPAASVFAWNEVQPGIFSEEALRRAEQLIFTVQNDISVGEHSNNLQNEVVAWAEKNQLEIGNILKYFSDEILNDETQHVGILSLSNTGKPKFINSLLNEMFLLQESSSKVITFYKYAPRLTLTEFNNNRIIEIRDMEEYTKVISQKQDEERFFEIKTPHALLKQHNLSFLELPYLSSTITIETNEHYFNFIDSLVILIDKPFGQNELEIIHYVESLFPDLKIYFVAVNQETYQNNKSKDILKGPVFVYSEGKRQKLFSLLDSHWNRKEKTNARLIKYLQFIKKMTIHLLEQRLTIENYLAEAIERDEDLSHRLNGVIHQLNDIQNEKMDMITQSLVMVKEETRKEILEKIPATLKECSELIKEDSDYRKIHIELNQEMNKKILEVMEEEILPNLQSRCLDWLVLCENELLHGKQFLEEISTNFIQIWNGKSLNFQFDSKILGDWQRDIDRITSKVQLKQENILLRYTPSQLLLKSAGKVIHSVSKNTSVLEKRYKSFVQNHNYLDVAKSIANQFLAPFALIEQGIERDVSMYFKDSFKTLEEILEETKKTVNERRVELEQLREDPEAFRDPLVLFQIRTLQYKYILEAEEMTSNVK